MKFPAAAPYLLAIAAATGATEAFAPPPPSSSSFSATTPSAAFIPASSSSSSRGSRGVGIHTALHGVKRGRLASNVSPEGLTTTTTTTWPSSLMTSVTASPTRRPSATETASTRSKMMTKTKTTRPSSPWRCRPRSRRQGRSVREAKAMRAAAMWAALLRKGESGAVGATLSPRLVERRQAGPVRPPRLLRCHPFSLHLEPWRQTPPKSRQSTPNPTSRSRSPSPS
mmetsp:Transcript_21676/g.63709  ORF Transcript_21676/g.63709 Transcript_21676/m.63709 type:complete len:226 (-) Transcript_21676:1936-2613(-)